MTTRFVLQLSCLTGLVFAGSFSHAQVPSSSVPSSSADLGSPGELLIADEIDRLSSRRFESRQTAFDRLVSAGLPAIEAVEGSATTGDLDYAHRCVEILAGIAREKQSREAALLALERLAGDDVFLGARLAKDRAFALRETKEERAVRLLTAAGVRFHRSGPSDAIRSVSGIFRDRQCIHLKDLPSLSSVTLSGAGVTDDCFVHLAKVPQLQSLSILRCSVTDSGLAELTKLPNLSRVSLSDASISPTGLRHLGGVNRLSSVALFHLVSAADLQAIRQLSLQSLYLSDVQMTEEVAQLLPQLDQIKRLTLSINDVCDDDLTWVRAANKLSSISLTIEDSPNVTDQGLEYLNVANLRSLRLRRTGITKLGLDRVAEIQSLGSLFIESTRINSEDLQRLIPLRSLRFLLLRDAGVSDQALELLKKSMPQLKFVRNYQNVAVRAPALKAAPKPADAPGK